MLLRLQRYRLRVKYKKGDQLFLADTLSHAYISDIYMLVNSHNVLKVLTMHPHWHWIMRDYSESETVHEMILSSLCGVK